jgi:general secretion pathway protein L
MAESAPALIASSDGYNIATGPQFLRWWKTHLWACVPERIRATAKKNARPMMISLADDAIWPERSDLAKPLRISKTTLLSGDGNKTRAVALVAGEASGLRRNVELPLAVEERLAQVLAYELDRLTPLRADELYYDYRLLSRSVARGVCLVELVAAPKKRVNEMIASAKAMGADVVRLVLAPTDIDEGIDLMRATRVDDATSTSKSWLTPALAALCALLALALVVYPIFKKRQYVIALLPIESSARAEAEAASIVQRQLDRQVTEYNHLLKRKHASPIAVQVLEDMTKRLPEDTWAQSFEIKALANAPAGQHPREVIVQGETGSGAKLLQMVQESTLLKDPVLKAAMTRVSPTAERFHFAGELVAVAPPPGLVLADASTVLGTPMQVMPNGAAGAPTNAVSANTPAPAKADAASGTPAAAPAVAGKSATQPPGALPQAPAVSGDYPKKSIASTNPANAPNSKANADNVAPFLQSEEKKQ